MANLTKAQREAKEKAEAKSDDVAEVVVETKKEVVADKPVAKKEAPKPVKLEEEDMVLVASYATGRTQLINSEKPYDETYWEKFGLVEEVRFGTLERLRRKNGTDTFTKFIYVLDEQAVKQLNLTKVYEEFKAPTELVKVFELPLEDIIKFIENAGKNLQPVLREILISKIQNKENINAFNLIAIAEKLEIDLDTIQLK